MYQIQVLFLQANLTIVLQECPQKHNIRMSIIK